MAGDRSWEPAGSSPATQGGPGVAGGQTRLRGPRRACWATARERRGRGSVGEGSRASQYHLARASHPRRRSPASRPPRCTHRGRGSVRAPSGCGVGGLRVCRSLGPDGPVPARVPSSGPSTNQKRLHFRSPCHSSKWLPEVPPCAARRAAGRARLSFLLSRRAQLGAQVSNGPCQVTDFVFFFSPIESDLSLHFSCNSLS